MTYHSFRVGVLKLLEKAGDTSRVSFNIDHDKGQFQAKTDSGVLITMPINEWKLTVRWGSGHTAMVSADVLTA